MSITNASTTELATAIIVAADRVLSAGKPPERVYSDEDDDAVEARNDHEWMMAALRRLWYSVTATPKPWAELHEAGPLRLKFGKEPPPALQDGNAVGQTTTEHRERQRQVAGMVNAGFGGRVPESAEVVRAALNGGIWLSTRFDDY